MTRWPLRVYILLALGALSFCLAPILVRLAGNEPGVAIAMWRTLIASVALLPPAVGWRIDRDMQQFTIRDVLLILGAGILLGLHFITWIESLYHTTVASASVLVTSSPLILAVFGFMLLGERLSRSTVVAIMLAVGGAALIGWADAGEVTLGYGAVWGNSLAFGAAVLVSGYLLIGRVVRRNVSWLAYVTPLYTIAAGTTLAAAWIKQVPLFGYSLKFYLLCAGLALGPQILGHGSFNYALQYVRTAIVGMLALIEPVGASIIAYFLFGEVPPLLSLVGMVIVLAAVAAVVWQRDRPDTEVEPASSTS